MSPPVDPAAAADAAEDEDIVLILSLAAIAQQYLDVVEPRPSRRSLGLEKLRIWR